MELQVEHLPLERGHFRGQLLFLGISRYWAEIIRFNCSYYSLLLLLWHNPLRN